MKPPPVRPVVVYVPREKIGSGSLQVSRARAKRGAARRASFPRKAEVVLPGQNGAMANQAIAYRASAKRAIFFMLYRATFSSLCMDCVRLGIS